MKPELSIILPSIRTERLEKLYDSILTSTTCTFELVIVGPYPLPEKLLTSQHLCAKVKFIHGLPTIVFCLKAV